jgi:hypothetical protein
MIEPAAFAAIRRLRLGSRCIEATLAVCDFLKRHGIAALPASVVTVVSGGGARVGVGGMAANRAKLHSDLAGTHRDLAFARRSLAMG